MTKEKEKTMQLKKDKDELSEDQIKDVAGGIYQPPDDDIIPPEEEIPDVWD